MRYFKRATDRLPGLGRGVVWFEFDGDILVRQVERYGDRRRVMFNGNDRDGIPTGWSAVACSQDVTAH
jgi:hypothetical protein